MSFSVSLVWFNDGQIYTSVPLVYPPLIYLGVRMALIGTRRLRAARRAADTADRRPPAQRPPRSAAGRRCGC